MGERLNTRGAYARIAAASAVSVAALAIAACGGEERRDANEPEAEYPVEVEAAKFRNRQRLAQTSELALEVRNVGDEEIPDLTVTIFLDEGSVGPFTARIDNDELADPNQPVWILENKFPRLADEPPPKGLSPAVTAEANTFAFGPVPPGEVRTMVWRVTPVKRGTYTVNYEVAAGTHGNARAVTETGGEAAGEFVVTITGKPPETRVNDRGEVVIVKPGSSGRDGNG